MQIHDLLTPARIQYATNHCNKKRLLELLSQLIITDDPTLDDNQVLQQFIARERLGSTAIGHGIALPHIRLKELAKPIGAFIRLDHGIPFDAADSKDVDLFFGLVVPEAATEEHLQILASLAQLFSQDKCCQQLRKCTDANSLYQTLCQFEPIPHHD